MIEFTPRETHIFSKKNTDKIKKKNEGQKVDEKMDFSIELEKGGQELPRDDGSEYC